MKSDKMLIGGTNCHKCMSGKYHFYELLKERENGLDNFYMRYKCDLCGHFCRRRFNINSKQEQTKLF